MINPCRLKRNRKPLHCLAALFILIFISSLSVVNAVEYCSVPCPDGFADCEAPCPSGSSNSSIRQNNTNIQEQRRRQEMEIRRRQEIEARRRALENSQRKQQVHERAKFEETKKQAIGGLKSIDDNSYNAPSIGGSSSTNELGLKSIDHPADNQASSGDNLWKIKQILRGGYKPPPRLLPNSGHENAVVTGNEKPDYKEQKFLKIHNLYSKLTASGKNKINALINDILASRSSAASKVKQHDEKLIEIVLGLLEKVRDHGIDSPQVQEAIRGIEQKILQNADETLGGG